jgi:glycosyltransferase involved in cell wall biosynthesis
MSQRLPQDRPTVFYMFPPPPEVAETAGARVVWIPMWDHARIYSQEWWDNLPPSLRVIALSQPVFDRASSAGLATLNLRYFLHPARLPMAEWEHGRVGFYWNRTGMLSPEAVKRLCKALSLDRLLFREQLDPRIPERMGFRLPGRLGTTEVIPISPASRQEYLEMTQQANIFIAPRTSEGVGLTFLEAMARGCCVIGYDAPTMNEYIRHGENGLLFRGRRRGLPRRAVQRLLRGESPFLVPDDVRWELFFSVDPARLGRRARLDHEAGHERWLSRLPDYARFVLDW